jgi:hypothetical protein
VLKEQLDHQRNGKPRDMDVQTDPVPEDQFSDSEDEPVDDARIEYPAQPQPRGKPAHPSACLLAQRSAILSWR